MSDTEVSVDDKSLTLKDKGMVESLKAEYGALSELERNAMPKDTVDHLNRIIDKMSQLIEEENKNKAEDGQIPTITKVTNPNMECQYIKRLFDIGY